MATSKQTGAGPGGPRRRTSIPDRSALAEISGRITALEVQQKRPKRRSVFVDGQFVLGLHEETVALCRWKVGLDVTGADLLAALARDELRQAWDDAVALLAARARARREVERKLASRYGAEAAAATVERLVAGGWLDDAAYARQYIQSHPAAGERKLLQDLLRQGVAADLARRAVAELRSDTDPVVQAREAVASRLARMSGTDRETAQRRLSAYLMRRGFDWETISRALTPLLADLPRGEARGFGRGTGKGLRRGFGSRVEEDM